MLLQICMVSVDNRLKSQSGKLGLPACKQQGSRTPLQPKLHAAVALTAPVNVCSSRSHQLRREWESLQRGDL